LVVGAPVPISRSFRRRLLGRVRDSERAELGLELAGIEVLAASLTS